VRKSVICERLIGLALHALSESLGPTSAELPKSRGAFFEAAPEFSIAPSRRNAPGGSIGWKREATFGTGVSELTMDWRWAEAKVDRSRDQLRLAHDGYPSSVVALVGPPKDGVFPVEFLVADDGTNPDVARILADVIAELDYYLLGLGEPDPWAYAHYHCRTASNVYGKVHWGEGEDWTGIPLLTFVGDPFSGKFEMLGQAPEALRARLQGGDLLNTHLKSEGDVRFVQFPHPGKEHGVGLSGVRRWPLGDKFHPHGRTFLQSAAVYRTALDGPDQRGEVAFWGEWEGEAELITELEPTEEGPRFLCVPNPQGEPPPVAADGTPPQNTDPFVWGDAIAYIGCRQPGNKKLRGLGRGSLILFGSNLGGRFVLDTVLVVAGWVKHDCETFKETLAGVASDAHMRAGISPFHGWGKKGTLRYYAGATPANNVSGMYSFVPSRLTAGVKSGFARPEIKLDEYINPNLRQQARSSDPPDVETITGLWRQVVGQVLDQRLALATRLELPR